MKNNKTALTEAQRALLAQRLQKARRPQAKPRQIEPMPADEPAPLSFAQRRLWFLYQWEPESPTYNIANAFRVTGTLDVPALERAFNVMVQRHTVLHHGFAGVAAEPVLVPLTDPTLRVGIVDLQHLAEEEQETAVQQHLHRATQTPFNLEDDLPLRVVLLRLTAEESIFVLTIHHIVSDGWSMGVLMRELTTLYTAYHREQEPALPPLPIQYTDFAYWQQQKLQDGTLARQMEYWQQQLHNAPRVLELPTDHPRPAARSTNGSVYYFELPAALCASLTQLSRQFEVSLFITLLSTFLALLHRYSGQDDLVVGSPVANRTRPELENLLGFFVNTLVLRHDLSGNPTFRQLLQRVREVALEAYDHQDLPFEQLVEALQPQRSLSHTPLFQVMFSLQNTPEAALSLPGATLTPLPLQSDSARFDLTVLLANRQGVLGGAVEYSTDLFDADTIARMMSHFQNLLTAVCANPETRLADLPLLSAAERQQQLIAWNDTKTPYPAQESLAELFALQVARQPQATAVSYPGETVSYEQLNRRANQLAHHLQALGVQPGELVGICVERSPDLIVGLLGILKAGGAYLPLDPTYPQERIAFMLADTRAHILITESGLLPDLPPYSGQMVHIDTDRALLDQLPTHDPALCVTADFPAYVMYTSGSTGRPKGIVIPQRAINRLVFHTNYMQLSAADRVAQVANASFDAATFEIWGALLHGGELIGIPKEVALAPRAFADILAAERITALFLTTALFNQMVRDVPTAFQSVNCVMFGGEAVDPQRVYELTAGTPPPRLLHVYGPTESTTFATWEPVGALTPDVVTVPIGRPLANTEIYLLDAAMQPVPVGVPGELYIGGAGLADGYWQRPDQTAARFIPHPFSAQPGARLYRTGDVARYLPDGRIMFVGRVDHQVKIRGFRIELGEIESVLARHDNVQEAAVLYREVAAGDKRLLAYVMPRQEEAATPAALRAYLQDTLPAYMIPAHFVLMDAFPLNPNGKVDRRALPLPENGRLAPDRTYVPPRTDEEAAIAAIWADVLGVSPIGIDDNFFDLGGESFKAIKVVAKIGHGLSAMDLFKYPTVRALAAHAAAGTRSESHLLHELTPPLSPEKRKTTVVCFPYAGASALIYQPLAQALPPGISLFAVQQPGHDQARPDEALLPLPEVADLCVEEIKALQAKSLVLYGHCIGGALTMAVARRLEADGITIRGIFLGGHFPSPRPTHGLLGWFSRLFAMERMPQQAHLEAAQSLGFFTDLVEDDVRDFVMRNYVHDGYEGEDYYTKLFAHPDGKTLQAPILCIIGDRDPATEFYEERYQEWEFFSKSVELAVIPQAGHYFLKHQATELAEIMAEQLPRWETAVQARVAPTETPKKAALPPERAQFNLTAFYIVAIGQLISMIGTGLTGFALGVWVYLETGSVTSLATISVFALLPGILVSPLAGALADRWNRRLVMIGSDALAASGTLLLAVLLFTDTLSLWHLFLVSGIGSVANAFQRPAYMAAVAQLVPKRYLGQANGLVQLGTALGNFLAPLLGGALLMWVNLSGIVLIDFATFLAAVTTLWLIRIPDVMAARQEEPVLRAIVKGWQYISKRHGFLSLVVFFVIVNYFAGMVILLLTPLTLALGTPALLGMITAVMGLGTLVGSLLMIFWGGRKRRIEGVVGPVFFFAAATLFIGWLPVPWMLAAGMFVIGVASALVNAHWMTLVQVKVGLELQGRVQATTQMLVQLMTPLGFVTVGFLADWMTHAVSEKTISGWKSITPGGGFGILFMVIGVILMIWTVLGYTYPPLRYVEEVLPDAIPDAVIYDKDEIQQQADRHLLPGR